MDSRITRKCKDCKTSFSFSAKEAQWLLDKNMELFKRCPKCRDKRKTLVAKQKAHMPAEQMPNDNDCPSFHAESDCPEPKCDNTTCTYRFTCNMYAYPLDYYFQDFCPKCDHDHCICKHIENPAQA